MILKRAKKWVRESINYLKESRDYIWLVVAFFFISAIGGFVLYSHLGFLNAILKQIAEEAASYSGAGLIAFIFANNVKSALMGMLFGIVFGIFPAATTFSNGIILGYVMRLAWDDSGIANLWRIFPHGIFELPAIFIALGLGVKLGMFIFARNRRKEFAYRFWSSVKAFMFIVVPLLIVAAIIEGLLITFL